MMVDAGDEDWNEEQVWESLIDRPTESSSQPKYDETPPSQNENLLYAGKHQEFESYASRYKEDSQLSDDRLQLSGTSTGIMIGWKELPTDELRRGYMSQERGLRQPQFSEIFTRTGDTPFTFADDVDSSLSSSLYTGVLTPSYSSSMPQQMESLGGSYLSPPACTRSRSSSLRTGSYHTGSTRNTSSGTTPKTRHTFISNNNCGDGVLSYSVSNEDRLKRKREFHNAVERRRRELIKLKIKELGTIVPPSLLNYDDNGKHVKPNKSIILNKTVEYMAYLLQVLEIQDQKKTHLVRTLQELEFKNKNLKILQGRQHQSRVQNNREQSHLVTTSTPSPQTNSDEFRTKIIDTDTMTSQSPRSRQIIAATCWSRNAPASDDLQQFLSGDVIEAEDNAKLMFGDGDVNPADYLLDFDP